jgi:hypothetical protein
LAGNHQRVLFGFGVEITPKPNRILGPTTSNPALRQRADVLLCVGDDFRQTDIPTRP